MSHKSKMTMWASICGLLLLTLVGLRFFTVWATTLPLDVPIRLDQHEVIEHPITVRTPEFDMLAVVFSTAEHPLFTVRKLSGGPIWENEEWVEYPPLPMTLGYRITTPDGKLVTEGQGTINQELTSYGSDEITRAVASVPLEPGDYLLRLEVLTPDARFAENATRVAFVAEGRGKTWQSSVAYWGALFSGLVLIPLAFICLLITLFHFSRWRYGPSRPDR